jgi:hypothetical protein
MSIIALKKKREKRNYLALLPAKKFCLPAPHVAQASKKQPV